ncbi:hypothetical protein HJC23_006167 [Cyclotella cryptica]|uniref:H(+)-exporting diphosphatase n=1 Tax=Cyclotella cryptica TaxID=29204 RepID=A0ABD3Q1F8_9STRA|eukprot:CCRYP_009775-RB/>CCRYP_009775-RB protein AED:0.06 eAED:0.06 QI:690/1/1/1/0.36/0.30/26/3983/708
MKVSTAALLVLCGQHQVLGNAIDTMAFLSYTTPMKPMPATKDGGMRLRRNNNITSHPTWCKSTHIYMALTEEFIQMKVNGDASAFQGGQDGIPVGDSFTGLSSINGSSSSSNNNHNNNFLSTTSSVATTTFAPPQRKLSPSDAVGYFALSRVKSLARFAGIAIQKTGQRHSDSNEVDGNQSSSNREEFLNWQRQTLIRVRREVAEGGVRSALIAALPSNKRQAEEEEEKEKVIRRRNGGANRKNSKRGQIFKIIKSEDTNDNPTTITTALQTLERDMSMLDNLASLQPQLSAAEVGLLLGAVVASGIGPIVFPGTSVTEVLAPAAAAFTASITIGSEYIGRVAVADGKEIAANTIQCAAEAEALLANAERVKAITPLCVGLGATCASFALLTPTLVEVLNLHSVQLITQIYLLCPLVAILSAAVANLALEETRDFTSRAINVGVRRFAKGGVVGRTWLSTAEQVQKNSKTKTDRWWSFAGSVLPAPILGTIFGPPALSTKCIIVAALAAAQSAYFLALAESVLARAQDAVALKARSAAVCDTYANQGSRNSAILPFTSALSAFCAAATAAIVELPFIDTVSAMYGTIGEVALVSTFPILSSAFAAAASVSKARCEVDAEAACQAASTLALEYDGKNGSEDDPVIRPFKVVAELIRLAVSSGWRSVRVGLINPMNNAWNFGRRVIVSYRWKRRCGSSGRRRIQGGEGLA